MGEEAVLGSKRRRCRRCHRRIHYDEVPLQTSQLTGGQRAALIQRSRSGSAESDETRTTSVSQRVLEGPIREQQVALVGF